MHHVIFSVTALLTLISLVPAWLLADYIYDRSSGHEAGIRRGSRAFLIPLGVFVLGLAVSLILWAVGAR